ncbi:hypothetical protein U1Q18_039563 [Sarracenia purpurea var. burkii]
MQQHMGQQLEEELKMTKAQLGAVQEQRDQTLDDLREMKMVAVKVNRKLSEDPSSRKAAEAVSELNTLKESFSELTKELKTKEKDIESLKLQIERGKLSEIKIHDTLVSQAKQLEQTKIELEELKLEAASLCGKENLAEMKTVKSELKLAIEAEDKSKKAMDDLALVLKEVAAEANHAKVKLSSTEMELEHVKQEAEQLKEMVRSTEDGFQKELEEAHKEIERLKNTIERLRLEAEESLLAWNDKEIGFVNCIKTAEEERELAQEEIMRLVESLKAAENTIRVSREENFKVRDILKQALNEANAAKEAAGIARAENSQLKDSHAKKDEALEFLTLENERLRVNEAEQNKSIKELKHLLSMASTKGPKPSDDEKKLNKAFSFDVSELKIPKEREDRNEKVEDEDPIKAEALKGSIFDTSDSPKSEPKTPLHRKVPSSFTGEGKTVNSEDLDYDLERSHFGDEENERNLQRKSRALLRRFGDLLKRKSLITIH